MSKSQLDYVRDRYRAGLEPQKSWLARTKNNPVARLTYVAKPVDYVKCGSHTNIDIGCTDEQADADAAYTQALLWYYTGDQAYAANARKIINAWSSTLRDHVFDKNIYVNGLLQAGWVGEVFPRAAEILRYSYPVWTQADTDQFTAMLDRAFLPRIRNGWSFGSANWNFTMNDATINIAVFKDDRALYDEAVAHWKNYIRGYIYHSGDGPVPARIPEFDKNFQQSVIWNDQSTFVDGLESETCRDTGHTMMGIAAAVDAAETARIQGTDLYGYGQNRLVPALEMQSSIINGNPIPAWLCPGRRTADGKIQTGATSGGTPQYYASDIGFNAYANRLGVAMPETAKMLSSRRPLAFALHMVWESLTHGDTSNLGGATVSPSVSPTGTSTSPTPSPTTSPSSIKGDINNDGKVNVQDLSTLLTQWGKLSSADLNGDGTVNVYDLSILLNAWSK